MTLFERPDWYVQNEEFQVLISRSQLHEMACSAPIRTLAIELGVSDVALSKMLRERGLPIPEREYWAKLSAGKPVAPPPLPPRRVGESNVLAVLGPLADRFRLCHAAPEDPSGPFATPSVPESLVELRDQLVKDLGSLRVHAGLDRPHRALHALLRRDERRRRKIAASTWPDYEKAPEFEGPDQQRKLRVVNTIVTALSRQGYISDLSSHGGLSFRTRVGDQYVHAKIYRPGETPIHRCHKDPLPPLSKAPLTVDLTGALPDYLAHSWQDGDNRLERQVGLIAATIIAAGEARYRLGISERLERIERAREWRAELQRQAESKRNTERLKALHTSAEMLRKANDLRTIIDVVKTAIRSGAKKIDEAGLAEWEAWANSEADSLDPVINGQVDEHVSPRDR